MSGRSSRGRRPGPSGTRDAILSAAARRFAEAGYDRTSLRAIAADASVDQKLIAHYFGSKQQLFVEAVGLPIDPGVILPAALSEDGRPLGERLRDVLVTLLEQPQLHERVTGVIRGAAGSPEVARMLREFLAHSVFAPIAAALDIDEPLLRANLVGSQVVGLLMARDVVRVEPLASTPAPVVAAAVAPTLERYLVAPLAAQSLRNATPERTSRRSTREPSESGSPSSSAG